MGLPLSPSDMISEHELPRVWFEEYLPIQVVDVVATGVVSDECDGNDERHQSLAVVVDQVGQLGASAGVQALF